MLFVLTSQLEAIKSQLLGVHSVRMNIINTLLLKLQIGLIPARLLLSVMSGEEVAEVREMSKCLILENGINVLFGASIDTARGCLAA